MCWKYYLLLIALLLQASANTSIHKNNAPSTEINHISFSQTHLFYISKSGNHFGFISRETGETMSKYEMKQQQSIISVNKQSDSVVLRSGKTKVVLFDIASSHLEEIQVSIAFKHQQIIDALKLNGKYYILTDKDARVYNQNEQKKGESLKNIITSGRKNQFFKKFFLKQGETAENMLIVLIKNGEVCVRTFKKAKKGTDECYFKLPYDITGIDRINNSILIQTNTVNYVIPEDSAQTYSFKGKVMQTSGEFIHLSDFKTYDLQNKVFLDGAIVEGSTTGHVFWIHARDSNRVSIFYNSALVHQVATQPRRSWVSQSKIHNIYDLLLEFGDNRFEMFKVQLINGKPANFSLKWTNKSSKASEKTSQL